MSSLIRVCDAVRCPYSKATGCDRYSVALHCHLLHTEQKTPRAGFADGQGRPYSSEYWIYADDSYDLAETRQLQAQFLAQEVSRAESIAKLQDKPYQVTWK